MDKKKGKKLAKVDLCFSFNKLTTHQVTFAALFELVMTHIFHRKKLDDVGAENLSKIIASVQKS